MTTDNGAVATADTEVTSQTQAEQPVVADTEVTPTGAGEEDAGASSEASPPEGTEGAEVPASLDDVFKPYEAGQLTPDEGATPAAPDSGPGIPLEEFEKGQRQNLAYQNATARQNAERMYVQDLVEAGYSEEDARARWNSRGRSLWNNFIASNDAYQEYIDGFVVGKLPQDVQAEFNKKVYPNRQAWVEGLVDTGRRLKDKEVQDQIKANELIPKKTHEKALTDAGRQTRANLERWLESQGIQVGQSSRNNVNGSSGGKQYANIDDLATAFNNKEISPGEYERQHVRITGKKPGE